VQLVRQLRVRSREDVRLRSLTDLSCQLVRAGEAVADLCGDEALRIAFERLLERGRRRDRDRWLPTAASAAAGEGDRGNRQRGNRAPHQSRRSTMTEVALTVATASTPSARPSSSTESRVIAAVTRNGPASISTSASTPSTSTDRTTPGKRLRAESWAPVL